MYLMHRSLHIGQTAEYGSFRRDLGCRKAKNRKCGCANQLPSALHKSAKVQK